MTRAELRVLVRSILEVDEEELVDVVLDSYLQEGFDKVVAANGDWPHLEIEYEFQTIGGQRDYDLRSIAPQVIRDVKQVIVIDGSLGGALYYVDHVEARNIWLGQGNGGDAPQEPTYWSQWNGHIHFWPKPDHTYTVNLIGWRYPADWTSAGSEPDISPEVHRAIAWWAIAAWYHQQEDSEMAQLYEARFERDVSIFVSSLNRMPQNTPMIYGGGGVLRNRSEEGWLQARTRGAVS